MKNFKKNFIYIYENLKIKDDFYGSYNIIETSKKKISDRIKNIKSPNNYYLFTIRDVNRIYNEIIFDDNEIREKFNKKIDRLGRIILDKRKNN